MTTCQLILNLYTMRKGQITRSELRLEAVAATMKHA